MNYASARYLRELEEKAYRIYVTDALKLISENTANFAKGQYLTQRFADKIERQKPKTKSEKEQDTRSCKEITADIWTRLTQRREGNKNK